MKNTIRAITLTGAAVAVAATGFAAAPSAMASTDHQGKSPAASAHKATGKAQASDQISDDRRSTIIERANSWVNNPVPYNMNGSAPDPDGKYYRADCSGFVSMAWGLDDSYSTVTLPDVSHEIAKDDLKPGDILLKGGPGTGGANGHVTIFNGWANDDHTAYNGIEQSGSQNTVAREIAYPYDQDSSYVPYRLDQP